MLPLKLFEMLKIPIFDVADGKPGDGLDVQCSMEASGQKIERAVCKDKKIKIC